jgi:hypothetical protein
METVKLDISSYMAAHLVSEFGACHQSCYAILNYMQSAMQDKCVPSYVILQSAANLISLKKFNMKRRQKERKMNEGM